MKRLFKYLTSLKGFTEFMFRVILVMGVIWVSISYAIGIYGAIALGMIEPLVDLSKEAMGAIIAVVVLKVVSNIFEHNDSVIFGISDHEKPEGKEDEANG